MSFTVFPGRVIWPLGYCMPQLEPICEFFCILVQVLPEKDVSVRLVAK